MAKDVERLVLELSADVSKLDRGMRQGQRIAEQRTAAIARSYDQMSKRTVGSVTAMSAGISASLAGLALGVAAREVAQYADAWTRASNSLRASGLSVADTSKQMAELVEISLRSRSALASTVTLYNRLTAASGELGVSQAQVARVVETVNKALATSNMSQGERASAVTQLAQGLGSGNLAGDELKAIRENSQVLAQAIADEFGVTIGELKKLGAEGELTSVRVFAAIEKASGKVDSAFGRTRATIDDALTNLQTKVTAFIGSLDSSTGASANFAKVVEFVANHLDEIATAATAAAITVGAGYAAAMTVAAVRTGIATASNIAYQATLIRMMAAQTGATAGQVALNAAMSANPIGLVIVAAAALAGGLYLLSSRTTESEASMEALAAQTTASDKALQNYETAQIAAKNASGASAVAARNNADAMRQEAEAAIIAARALAAKATATAQARLTAATAAFQQATSTGPREEGEAIGQLAVAASAQKAYASASEAAAAAIREQIRQEQTLARITAGVNLGGGGPRGGAAADDKKAGGRGASGPTAAELAATREMLTLEMALARMEAQGRTADAEQIQSIIDKINLTKELRDAGVENAEAAAAAQVDAIRLAEAAARGRETAEERAKFFTDAAAEALAAYNAELDRQLQVQLEIARLNGDDQTVLRLERELRLRQEINALGPNASAAQKARVRSDDARVNDAEDMAIFRERGEDMARSFLDIVSADDPWKAAGDRFREAAFDNLEAVLGNIFAQIMGGNAQGGGWGDVAAKAVGSLFGGRRALGGPVKAGRAYQVNENTPNSEYFVPKSDGWVGNIKQPRGGQRTQQNVTVRNELYLAGANGDAVIYANVSRMLATSQRQTVAAIKAGAPAAQLEQTLLRE